MRGRQIFTIGKLALGVALAIVYTAKCNDLRLRRPVLPEFRQFHFIAPPALS
jgi:hypothetical protein